MCDSRAMSDDSTGSVDQEEAAKNNMGEDYISSDEEDIEGDTDMKCDDEDESSLAVAKKPRFSSVKADQPTSQNQAKERVGQLRELR